MITVNDWVTSSGNHPERAKDSGLDEQVLTNAQTWCDKINAALPEMGYRGSYHLSSGYRPAAVNAETPGAAQHSGHMYGLAGDFLDPDADLWNLCASNPDILRKYGLFIEDRKSTPTWCHIDWAIRPDRPSRVFIP